MNTLSWANATTPLPMEINPRVDVRADVRPAGDAARSAWRGCKTDRSILDSVKNDVKDLENGLGPRDRARLNDYLDNVREIEQRIQRAEKQATTERDRARMRPSAFPSRSKSTSRCMFDLLALAYEANITRVFTFMMSRDASQRVYPNIGVTEPHHAMSHHGNNPEKLAEPGQAEHVSRVAVREVPGEAAVDSRRRRLAARSFADPLRQRHERERHALTPRRAGRILGGGAAGTHEGQPSHPGAEGNAAGEPDARHRQQVRLRDRQVRHAQHGPGRHLAIPGILGRRGAAIQACDPNSLGHEACATFTTDQDSDPRLDGQ